MGHHRPVGNEEPQDRPPQTSGQRRTPGWTITDQWRRMTKINTRSTDSTAVHHGHVGHKGPDGRRLWQLGGCAAVKCSDCHRRRVIVNVIDAYNDGRLGRQRVMTAVTCYHHHVIDRRFLVIDNALQIGQRHVLGDDLRHAMFNSISDTNMHTRKLAAISRLWSHSIGVTG